MPIYEFYCEDCHTIFNFFSRKVDTASRPQCPKCRKQKLQRQVSVFATARRGSGKGGEGEGGGEGGGMDDLPIDEAKMESAVETLASEAEGINEDDPRQAAQLMRKFSNITGLEFGKGMQQALDRMEAGEDPEKVEADMGDVMENEEPFILPGKKGGAGGGRNRHRGAPARDKTLHEM